MMAINMSVQRKALFRTYYVLVHTPMPHPDPSELTPLALRWRQRASLAESDYADIAKKCAAFLTSNCHVDPKKTGILILERRGVFKLIFLETWIRRIISGTGGDLYTIALSLMLARDIIVRTKKNFARVQTQCHRLFLVAYSLAFKFMDRYAAPVLKNCLSWVPIARKRIFSQELKVLRRLGWKVQHNREELEEFGSKILGLGGATFGPHLPIYDVEAEILKLGVE